MTPSFEYLDFELELDLDSERTHQVSVVRSPLGEVSAYSTFPYDELELKNNLLTLENSLLRSGGQRRGILTQEEKAVQQFGQALFEFIFAGEIRSLYRSCQAHATQRNKGLRLKLRIQDPKLASLPWEYLFDSQVHEYICLSSFSPIVRYSELTRPPELLNVTPPLRILGMVASPEGLSKLDILVEQQRLSLALGNLIDQGKVELVWLAESTQRALRRALNQETWHIFHFIGHGAYDPIKDEGMLVLADSQNRPHSLYATSLARLLGDHPALRLAVLNSCEGSKGGTDNLFSSTASIVVRRGIPAVVAMQYEITDRAAVEFARTFYESISDGLPIDTAVSEARKSISIEIANTVEWGVPVLHMRAPDGRLFALESTQSSTTAQLDAAADTKETPRSLKPEAVDDIERDFDNFQSQPLLERPDRIFQAELSEREIAVDVEQPAQFYVKVTNTGSKTVRFGTKVGGVDPQWVLTSPESLQLFGNESQSEDGTSGVFSVTITPPRHHASTAGEYKVTFVVTALEYPEHHLQLESLLTVQPYYSIEIAEASGLPKPVSLWRPTALQQFMVSNAGNSTAHIQLDILGKDRSCRYELRVLEDGPAHLQQADLVLAAGKEKTITLKIRFHEPPLISLRTRIHEYDIRATLLGSYQLSRTLPGRIKVRPVIGSGIMLSILILLLSTLSVVLSPTVDEFYITNTEYTPVAVVEYGTPVVLNWSASRFSDVSLQGPGLDVATPRPIGTVELLPVESAFYYIDAQNFFSRIGIPALFGMRSRTTIIQVTPVDPVMQLSVDKDIVTLGESVRIDWSIQRADRALLVINNNPTPLPTEQFVGSLSLAPNTDLNVQLLASNPSVADSGTPYSLYQPIIVVTPTPTPSLPISNRDTTMSATADLASTQGLHSAAEVESSSSAIIVIDFEISIHWRTGDSSWGSLSHSSDKTYNGQYSGKLDYSFPASAGAQNFVVFRPEMELTVSGQPTVLNAWVDGDGKGNFLNAWVRDQAGQTWQFTFGQIQHVGWQQMTAPLDLNAGWPVGKVGTNTGATVLTYPLTLVALVLDSPFDNTDLSGVVYIDDIAGSSASTIDASTESGILWGR